MNRTTAILILLFAAALEAGGDAIIRMGLHTNMAWRRYGMLWQPRSFSSPMA
jgi:hypothetical protein